MFYLILAFSLKILCEDKAFFGFPVGLFWPNNMWSYECFMLSWNRGIIMVLFRPPLNVSKSFYAPHVYVLMFLSRGGKMLQIISRTSIYDCLGNHKLNSLFHLNNSVHTISLDYKCRVNFYFLCCSCSRIMHTRRLGCFKWSKAFFDDHIGF